MPKSIKASISEKLVKPLSVNCGNLNISVDPRIELLAIIQYLSGSSMVEKDNYGYAESIAAWFSPYKEHPAIVHLQRLEPGGFLHDLPVCCFLQYEGVPLTKTDKILQSYLRIMNKQRMHYVGKRADYKAFISEVNDFAHQSGFALFFQQQKELFQSLVASAEALLGGAGLVESMVEWYGINQHSFNFIISPLQGCGGYGLGFEVRKGGCDLYCISALQDRKITAENHLNIAWMLYHEFSHTYINHLADEHYKTICKTRKLHKPIKTKLAAMAYDNWWTVVVEHFVRAATIRLLKANPQTDSAFVNAKHDESQGFIYLEHFIDSLVLYETARKQTGVNYIDYYPVLINNFVEYARLPHPELLKKARFSGPIDRICGNHSILIIPDPKINPGVQEYIMPDVDFMVQRFRISVITDTQALKRKLTKTDIYVYGTIDNNKWLKKHVDLLPFRILPDMIITDREYPGTDLRIISCLPNPADPMYGLVIYTAQTMEAMKNSNSVFHGAEDYVLSDSTCNIIGKGYYDKTDGVWRF